MEETIRTLKETNAQSIGEKRRRIKDQKIIINANDIMKKEALASKKPAIRYFESSINTLKDHCGNKHTRKVLMKELGKIRLEKNENIASDLISAVLSMLGIRSDYLLEPNCIKKIIYLLLINNNFNYNNKCYIIFEFCA